MTRSAPRDACTPRDPWIAAEGELVAVGYDLDRIPKEMHAEHLWSDGILLLWTRLKRAPTPEELAFDMFDEWDDPVSVEEAAHVLAIAGGDREA